MYSCGRTCGALLLFCTAISPAFSASLSFLTTPGAAVDTVNWAQLGADGTTITQNFSAASAGSVAISGSMASAGGGLTSVVCDPSNPVNCSWGPPSGGYAIGDSLVWAENPDFAGSGPITLAFAAQGGVGAYLQTTAAGAFSASLGVYNGNTLLGTNTFTSNGNGDALFLGVVSDIPNITSVVFTGLTCGSFGCDANDFSIDTLQIYSASTPEPSTFLLAGTLYALGLVVRRSLKNGGKVQ